MSKKESTYEKFMKRHEKKDQIKCLQCQHQLNKPTDDKSISLENIQL